jgi:transcriptional regulator with XRE-family HTH domain
LVLKNRDFGFAKMRDEQETKTLSLGALANALRITRYNAEQLEKKKIFTKVARGQYDLAACVEAFVRFRVETEVREGLEAAKRADEVSVADLADYLGIGERWVQQLETQGVLSKSARGRYPLAASFQAYLKFKIDSEVARANPEETTPGERVKIERARKLKLENDERERQTVLMPDALIALDVIFGMIKAGFAGVPARVTDDVALRRRIEDGNEAVLRDLARRFRKAASAMREGRDPDAAVEEDDG